MLCNKCKKNNATIYLKQNVNGVMTTLQLCPECAKELGLFGNDEFDFFSPGDLFSKLYFSEIPGKSGYHPKKCPVCGAMFSDFRSSGRVGCAECYNIFRNEILPNITHIHGNVSHIGKNIVSDKVNDAENKNQKKELSETEKLKIQLKSLVAEEKYEEAAIIRDKIKQLSESEE